MKGHGSQFGRKKDDAIIALMTQRSIDEAAKSIDIVPNTLLRWMKDPEFDRAYRQARRKAFGQAISRLHQLSSPAVATLGKVMVDATTPPSVKVRAAETILAQGARAIELEDIEERLAELERAAEATAGGRK